MWWMRNQAVVATVVYEEGRGFFVGFNDRWRAYALPMKRMRETDLSVERTAIRALSECVGLPLPHAEAKPLEFIELDGRSERTGGRTHYAYQVCEVDPGSPLPFGDLASRWGYLPFEDLLNADLVSWSTKLLLTGIMENQDVALAVITRGNAQTREYLMVGSANYGLFFPASRLKTDATPVKAAVAAVRDDTGYQGKIEIGAMQPVQDRHFSPRFNQQRRFVFYVCGVKLGGSPDALEKAIRRRGARWRWVTEAELHDPAANGLSPTVDEVRPAVLQVANG
jgi:hypothetical protein